MFTNFFKYLSKNPTVNAVLGVTGGTSSVVIQKTTSTMQDVHNVFETFVYILTKVGAICAALTAIVTLFIAIRNWRKAQ